MDAPPTSVYFNIIFAIEILAILFCKIEKYLNYTLKIRILKIPIFFVEKWRTSIQKKNTAPNQG